MQLNTPILFLTYKRFETSEKVFESIKNARPKKLYFVSNAPKKNDIVELEKVQKVRSLVKEVNWDCDVVTLFRDEYLDVKESITFSIDWFFEHEDKGIILEDDCVPSQTFYPFCQELLDYYQNDESVFSIGGCCFLEDKNLLDNEYRFSRHTYIWGWATWKRAWLKYDVKMTNWPVFKKSKDYKNIFKNFVIRSYWTNIFNMVYENKFKTWDYQWLYTIWLNNGISIIPNRNLISNIGFGIESNFANDRNSLDANLKTSDINLPLKHINEIIFNNSEQKYVEKKIYKITFQKYLINSFYKKYVKFKNIFKIL